jgi:hypothetical protein
MGYILVACALAIIFYAIGYVVGRTRRDQFDQKDLMELRRLEGLEGDVRQLVIDYNHEPIIAIVEDTLRKHRPKQKEL